MLLVIVYHLILDIIVIRYICS